MRQITQKMKDYLRDNNATTLAYFMTIVTKDGKQIRVNETNEDFILQEPLVVTNQAPPYTYYSGGYIPTEYAASNDNSVQKMDISGLVKENLFDYNLIINNYYEGAQVYISICNYEDFSMGQIKIARGVLGNFEINEKQEFTCEIRGFAQKMNNEISTLYSRSCRNKLFDNVCALNQNNYTELNSVIECKNSLTITVQAMSQAPSYYAFGTLSVTSGQASGQKSNVRRVTVVDNNYVIELVKPISIRPQNGDSVNIKPGCDKTIQTCKNKFNNVDNFNGEPYIPAKNVFNVMGDGQESKKGKNPLLG